MLERARTDDVLLFSAGLAFYALVSIAPLVILTLWLVSLVLGEERIRQLAQAVREIAPARMGADTALLRVAELGTTIGVWAIVTGMWPATAYGSGLVRAFTVSRRMRSER